MRVLVGTAVFALAAPAVAQAAGLPATCPRPTVVGAALRENIAHVTTYSGRISSTTLPGMGPAPDSAHYTKTSQRERTCTYSGAPSGPITITFVSPVTTEAFARSRAALRKSGVAVATVPKIGDTAWGAKAGGLLFVLKGSVDVVISAPRTSLGDLKALANEIV